jgi:DNA modification methylase
MSPGGNRCPLPDSLQIERVSLKDLKPLGHQTRKHSPGQITKLARGVAEFGQVLPILVDAANCVVDGAAVVEALRHLGLPEIWVVRVSHLSEAQTRALRLALNRLPEETAWDSQALNLEFQELLTLDTTLDLTISGFDTTEIDLAISAEVEPSGLAEDAVPKLSEISVPVCRPGDLWRLGDHRLLCADATRSDSFERLLGDEAIDLTLTDPPYNVPIHNHVSGKGRHRHREFAMASGELDEPAFCHLLRSVLGLASAKSRKGALFYIFMDWRHQFELLTALRGEPLDLLNLCVWNKGVPGMGSFYRSQHELISIAKKPGAPHVNNIHLGRYGRNRGNVWTYPGANSFGGERDAMLAAHPTVKPVSLLADAIQDASNRGDLILDPFAGSGSVLIAAHRMGRIARLIEIDPSYCDLTLERFRRIGGPEPTLVGSDQTYSDRQAQRLDQEKPANEQE